MNVIEEFKKKLLKDNKKANIILNTPSGEILQRIPVNIPPLDALFGGGIPLGRVIEIYGKQSSAKTTLALEFAKAFTKFGAVYIIDTERTINHLRLQSLGFTKDDLKNVIFLEGMFLEDIFKNIKTVLEQKLDIPQLFIIDTLAQCPCISEVDNEDPFSKGISFRARAIKLGLRIISKLQKENTTIIFNNHVIAKIGGYVASEDSPGGRGVKFLASLRLHLKPVKKLENIEQGLIRGVISKNKIGRPNQEFELVLNYTKGVLPEISTVNMLSGKDQLFNKAGGWVQLPLKNGNIHKFRLKDACSLSKDENMWQYIKDRAFGEYAPEDVLYLKNQIPEECLNTSCKKCKKKTNCEQLSIKKKLGIELPELI